MAPWHWLEARVNFHYAIVQNTDQIIDKEAEEFDASNSFTAHFFSSLRLKKIPHQVLLPARSSRSPSMLERLEIQQAVISGYNISAIVFAIW